MLREKIVGVIADPYFTIPSEEAKTCLQAARVMLQFFAHPTEIHRNFSGWLFAQLFTILETAKTKENLISKEKLWIDYHELTSSKLFITKWKVFLAGLSEIVPPLLYQRITDELFEDIIKKSVRTLSEVLISETGDDDICTLSLEEENTIHYVGGYVLQHFKKDRCNSTSGEINRCGKETICGCYTTVDNIS